MTLELVDDLRYSILELNAHAMQRSQVGHLAEAQQLLETAYIRLQSADAAVLAADAGLIDQLKATTLSNLGVVECHKKELDKSLDHLEAALAIEKRIGIFSPTTALNLCATFNALGRFEEAVDICSGAIQSLMATNGGVPTDDNKTLWAAAWHNLSVAEMNLGGDFGGTDERRVAVLNMFRNAMRASVDLLGPKHPLTATIHDSYRAARPALKKQGAYKVRDSFLPMLSNSTTAGGQSTEKRRAACTQTLTEDEKLGSVPAYEGALAGNTGRTNIDAAASRRVPSLLNAVRKAQRGDAFRPTVTLVRAQPLYLSHHPATVAAPRQSEALLQPKQRELRNQHVPSIAPRNNPRMGGGSPSKRRGGGGGSPTKRKAQTARVGSSSNAQRRSSPPGGGGGASSSRGGGEFNPATHKVLSSLSGGGAGGSVNDSTWAASNNTAKQRSIEQALIGDMWVEVEVPLARRNSPPQGGAGRGGNNAPALRQAGTGGSPLSWGGGFNTGEFRAPAYGQAMHVIEPSDPIMERVAQPSSYAAVDSGYIGGGGGAVPVLLAQPAAVPSASSFTPAPLGIVPHPQSNHVVPAPQQQQQQAPASMMSLAMQPNAMMASCEQQQPQQEQQQQSAPSNYHSGSQQVQEQLQQRHYDSQTPPGVHQQQQQQASPPIPQPPKRPASSGTRPNPIPRPTSRPTTPKDGQPQQQQQQQQPQQQGGGDAGFGIFADALGNDIAKYPGLQLLSTM